jgi:Fungal specific transcription factor domain
VGKQTNHQSVQACPLACVDYSTQTSADSVQFGTRDLGVSLPQFLGISSDGNTSSSLVVVPQENQQGQSQSGQLTGPSSTLSASISEGCIEAFFHYFYAAHPFLLPKALLLEALKAKGLHHLEAAVKFIGSHYVAQASTTVIGQEVSYLLASKDCPRDGFTVQTLLLLAICLDGDTEQEKALEMLGQAQDLALELGMHQREFAITHGEGSPVLEESWRRTWWELYIVDGMVAGVHQQSSFRLDEVVSSVLLPCEEQEYTLGVSFYMSPESLNVNYHSIFLRLIQLTSLTTNRSNSMMLLSRPLPTVL